MKLQFKKDTIGLYGDIYRKNEIKEYRPWYYDWQGMSETERVKKGIFVECYGQGEFEVFRKDDVFIKE